MSESPPSSANASSESASPEAAPPPNGRGDGAVAMAPAADVPDGQFHLDQSDEITDDRTNADIFETSISEEVYEQNYQYGTDTHVPDTWYRNARYLASVEENQERWTERFYQLLSGHGLPTGPFPFTPGGRIFANAGTSLGKATLINCFVSGFQGHDQDSMDEIQAELTRQAKILASEGGYGFCAHVMRPRGSRIGGVGSMTPGAVQMLDCWNEQAATIVAGSGLQSDRDDVKDKIRKGAQMVTMGVWHPDIIEFIKAKQEPGRLHKFNMSILISDAFMKAVKNDEKWALRFPAFEEEPEFYQEHWDGNLQAYEAKGGTVKTWRDPATGEKAVYDAREIWDLVMDSTYNRNEPGVIFVDTINRENNLQYCEHINATNPCGEQVLPVGGVCLLGNFNLTQFVDREAKTIDYDLLDELIPSAVRFLDNVNDLSYVPLEEQRRNLQQKRRIGLGHFGDGSALMMMKTRYGSEEGVSVMREFQQHLANKAYQASARLAEEKGAFPLFDKDEYLSNPFVQRLSDETKEMIGDLGLRNSHLLSIQPTGNTSTLANAPSSGIEPVFMHSYIRTSEQPALPDALTAPEMSPRAYSAGDTVDADGTTWAAEEHGDEVVLRCTEEGYTQWQIHPTRGICKDEKVEDYAVRHMKDRNEWDAEADWAVTTRDLDVDDHLRQMEALAPFIDSSMSKCVVEGTRIQTSCGPVRIEEFYDGEQAPDTFSEPAFNAKASDGRGNMQPITKAYYGGEKPCVEVKVRTGETIKCSRTHKLLTPSGWKRASELEKGEPVAINHAPVETSLSLQQVPQPDFSNAISRTFPTHLTETFAKFLGMWFADGSINENSIRVHEKDERVRRVASGLLDELFGECKTQTDCRTGVRTHEIHSRPLAQYFKKHYGGDASEKAPPEELFRSPKSVKKAFLEGLTLDGYVDKTQSERLTVYEGYSKGLRDAAAYLLAELGVRVHLRSKEVSGASSGSDKTFSVRAYLRGDTLEPVESHKREYSTREFGAAKRLVRDPEQYMELPATDHPDYIGLRNLRRSLKRSGVVQKSALDALGVGYDDKLGWSKTTEVRDIGRQPVYDVEVADTHSYRVGNIVSHNTVNVPADYPFDEFKDLYRKAWETGSIKGVTTYRAGTMSAVLSGSGEDEDTLPRTEAPDRPEELPCAIHRVRYRGDHWTVLVGFLEEDPYEVFAFKSEGEAPLFGDPAERIDEGVIRKNESRHYSLLTPEDDVVIDDITSHMPSDEARVETRLVSTALRHGSKVDFLVEQLEKAEGSIASFGRAMAKALSAHAESHEVTCDKCGSSNVRHVEGCMMCADCGHSRCS